jgi:hypothetical protein
MASDLAILMAWDTTLLPKSVTTKGGAVFNPQDDLWNFRDGLDNIRLDYSELPMTGNCFVPLSAR